MTQPPDPFNHDHDMVRVEDEQNGLAWETCRGCTYRTDPVPWAPMTQAELDEFNAARARAAMDGEG